MNIKWLCLGVGVMALLAIIPSWPYFYYQVLRWVISGSSLIVAWKYYEFNRSGWVLVFGAIAIIFNPILPFYMNRSSWTGIDFITGLLFLLASQAYKVKK